MPSDGDGALTACVIGVGAIGRHHARVLSELPGVRLAAVCDSDAASRDRYRRPSGVEIFADASEMLRSVRPGYVVVATPTEHHAALTCQALEGGAAVLVEKPIACTLEEADRMIACAAHHGRTLGVGHLERVNPAVEAMAQVVRSGELGRVLQLHARRMGPAPRRQRAIGVALDIATHDLDVMHFLTRGEVSRMGAETAKLDPSAAHEDMLSALLRFERGEIGILDVHWLSPRRVRELSVVCERGVLLADYLSQEVSLFKGASDAGWARASHFSGAALGEVVVLPVQKREPLWILHEDFLASLTEGRAPKCTAADGRWALATALRLLATAA